MPVASTSKSNERRKMEDLADVGKKAIQLEASGANGSSEEQLLKASDAIIDLMKASWWDDEALKGLSRPLKDSRDKIGLIGTIRGLMMKSIGFFKLNHFRILPCNSIRNRRRVSGVMRIVA
jgi:hypothetical protein